MTHFGITLVTDLTGHYKKLLFSFSSSKHDFETQKLYPFVNVWLVIWSQIVFGMKVSYKSRYWVANTTYRHNFSRYITGKNFHVIPLFQLEILEGVHPLLPVLIRKKVYARIVTLPKTGIYLKTRSYTFFSNLPLPGNYESKNFILILN